MDTHNNEEIEEVFDSPAFDDLFGELEERKQLVLNKCFGINGHQKLTLVETGKLIGVSRDRVMQIRNVAVRELRHKITRYLNAPLQEALAVTAVSREQARKAEEERVAMLQRVKNRVATKKVIPEPALTLSKAVTHSGVLAEVDSHDLYKLAFELHYEGCGFTFIDVFNDTDEADQVIISVPGLEIVVEEINQAKDTGSKMLPVVRELVMSHTDFNLKVIKLHEAIHNFRLNHTYYIHVVSDASLEEMLLEAGIDPATVM